MNEAYLRSVGGGDDLGGELRRGGLARLVERMGGVGKKRWDFSSGG